MIKNRQVIGLMVILGVLALLPVFLMSSGLSVSRFLRTVVVVDEDILRRGASREEIVIDIGESQELTADGSFGVCSDRRSCPTGYICDVGVYKCRPE